MKFTTLAFFASSVLAAPIDGAVSAAAAAEWTFQGVTRTTNYGDTIANWTFTILGSGPAVPCTHLVNATASSPASQSNGGPTTCGAFTILSGWSGQFGPGKGFTTISVVDYPKKLIAYPAYTDNEVGNGTAVSPDRSYPVQSLP